MKAYFILLIFTTSFAGCDDVKSDQELTILELEKQLQEIYAFIDNGACSQDSECSFMPYGSKACGGPQGYLLFSSGIDVQALHKMVEKHRIAEETYNKQNRIISDCSIPAPPEKLACEDGKCIQIQ
ncbi:hypothetical protein [Gillisia limnaea]|uniref:Lipoprotein n=1 Tax=Gillisia limnaea (strain DSM 15749 / LMG 21470 / R-8282) TaxID=865937 RepID=H2BVF4_GILLR|nr:hypothetical protein [Gillisia limnaea]EHQ02862.1 hypothetical protein Gilli_2229 [Gillisia limnaea DSM 15749]